MTFFFDQPALRGGALMAVAGLCFALVNACIQAATMLHGAGSAAAVFAQYAVALLFSLGWLLRSGLRLRMAQPGLHLLRVALAVAGVQLWAMGLAHVPIWQAIALVMTSPFFVATGAALLLGERVDAARWGAIVAGFAGGLLILSPWSEDFSLYALCPLAAAALWGGASLATKRLTRDQPADLVTAWLLILLTPANALIALGEGWAFPATGPALLLILGAGLLTALAQHLLTRAYEAADAAYLQPFDHLKLPLNVALGWAAFGFMPDGVLWPGAALIIGASLYILRRESRMAAQGTGG